MSSNDKPDRLIPTAPGWWWGRWGDNVRPVQVAEWHGALWIVDQMRRVGDLLASAAPIAWIEPIPAPGVVAALTAERDLAQAAVRAFGELMNGAAVYRSDHAPARTMIVDPVTFDRLKAMFPKT